MPVVDRHLTMVVDRNGPFLFLALHVDAIAQRHGHGIALHAFISEEGLQHEAGEDARATAHHEWNLAAHAIRARG